MRTSRQPANLFVSLWSLLLATSLASAGEPLAARLEAIIDAREFRHAHWGLLIEDLENGHVLYERNPEKLFAPASTTKLFSVACALDALGADFRFETPVYSTAPVSNEGEVAGNLILVASGDLSLGGRTNADDQIAFKDQDHTYAGSNEAVELTEPDPLGGLNELARQVREAGVTRVLGDVVIDDRLFDAAQGTGSGPGSLTPIMVNDNLLDFVITPGEPGTRALVSWRPQTEAYQVDAQVETAAPGEKTDIEISSPADGRLLLRGQIAAERAPLVVVHEVEHAPSFARSLFIEALARANVSVKESALARNRAELLPDRQAYDALTRVALFRSAPFSESARLILKVSHNLHASTLPLLVAAHHGDRTLEQGLEWQHAFLATAGVDVDSISFGGGAGGDRADYVTPRATVQLLRSMSGRPDFETYFRALPRLGVDGTSARHLAPDSPAVDKFQAKTGTLYWFNTMNGRYLLTSKALAGYGTTASGRKLVFALFVNNLHLQRATETLRIGQLLGRLCEQMYADE